MPDKVNRELSYNLSYRKLAYLQPSLCFDNPFFNRSGVREKVPTDAEIEKISLNTRN